MLGPDVHVWARLQDGTPLVTERKLGEGQIILFHVTANSDWSNLPLSGLFVEMLRRIAPRHPAPRTAARAAPPTTPEAPRPPTCCRRCRRSTASASWRRRRRLRSPSPRRRCRRAAEPRSPARLLRRRRLAARAQCARAQEPARAAARAADRAPNASSIKARAPSRSSPGCSLAALALLFADIIAVMLLQAGGSAVRRAAPRRRGRRDRLRRLRARPRCSSPSADAQRAAPDDLGARPAAEDAADDAARHPGDEQGHARLRPHRRPEIDEISRPGLDGLGRLLAVRTAVEPGEPMGVNILDRRDRLLSRALLAGAARRRRCPSRRSPRSTPT